MGAFSISTRSRFDDSYAQRAIEGPNGGGVLYDLGTLDALQSVVRSVAIELWRDVLK